MYITENLIKLEATLIYRPSVSQDFYFVSDHGALTDLVFNGGSQGNIEDLYQIYFPDRGNWYLIEAGYNADNKAWINFHYRTDDSGTKHYSIISADIIGTPVSDIVRDVLQQEFCLDYDDIPSFISYLDDSLKIIDCDGLVDPDTDPEDDTSISDDVIILSDDDFSEA